MLERLEHPELPIRDVLAPVRLVVRQSCGAQLNKPGAENGSRGTGPNSTGPNSTAGH
ncbi:MAG: hypothetical protein WBD67_09810 [Terracidiphilus sp.]